MNLFVASARFAGLLRQPLYLPELGNAFTGY
ncbi:MAG: hypothetical protein ACJAVI_001699 [Candidatus Azotimanducaceae bacterium]|jgi:hypothetical protein